MTWDNYQGHLSLTHTASLRETGLEPPSVPQHQNYRPLPLELRRTFSQLARAIGPLSSESATSKAQHSSLTHAVRTHYVDVSIKNVRQPVLNRLVAGVCFSH